MMNYGSDNNYLRMAFVDSNGVNSLCYDIQSYAENIRKSLNRIEDLVADSSQYYYDDTRNYLVDKHDYFKSSYNIIINNMYSYIDDYNSVVSKFKNKDNSITLKGSFEDEVR